LKPKGLPSPRCLFNFPHRAGDFAADLAQPIIQAGQPVERLFRREHLAELVRGEQHVGEEIEHPILERRIAPMPQGSLVPCSSR